MTVSTTTATTTPIRAQGGVGTDAARPDGTLKVTGEFAYGSDLWADEMLWGVTLRSPHPAARIRSIDLGPALAVPGVYAVLTADDVPGEKRYGLELQDQPVLAIDVVRYQGEPVALVAAEHPETARRAAARIAVDYEVLEPVTDARAALGHGTPDLHPEPTPQVERSREAAPLHPEGNLIRHLKIRKGDVAAAAARDDVVVVVGDYETGMQDQAFLGPESGLAVPAEDGGVDLFVATQWLHVDQQQICRALGLPPEKVRLTLSGVGGAFGGREDLSMHVHACLLAMHTGKPVKMSYNREESFFGHVHRHPAQLHYEHGFTRDGTLVLVRAEIWLDGGAYASSSAAVVGNAGLMGIGPYVVPNVAMDCYGAYTNNPPCGAMRGFGAVQAAYGYESQMDKAAAVLGIDPIDLRCRNAMSEGAIAPTGQVVDSAAPVAELLRRLEAMPLPSSPSGDTHDLRRLPGGVANIDARRGGTPWGRLRGRLQEHRLLGGLRRLLDRPGPAGADCRRARRHGAHRGRRGGPGPGHGAGSRSPAPSSGSTGSWSRRPTPRSAAAGRRRRPGRPMSPAARCARPAGGSATGWSPLAGGGVVGGRRRPARLDLASARRRRGRGDRRVAAPADGGRRPRDRPGRRARAVRLRRAPGGCRRRRRARPGQGGRARRRPGRRQGGQPAGRRSGRSTAAPRRAWGWP